MNGKGDAGIFGKGIGCEPSLVRRIPRLNFEAVSWYTLHCAHRVLRDFVALHCLYHCWGNTSGFSAAISRNLTSCSCVFLLSILRNIPSARHKTRPIEKNVHAKSQISAWKDNVTAARNTYSHRADTTVSALFLSHNSLNVPALYKASSVDGVMG